MTIPNILTLMRIIAGPVLALTLILEPFGAPRFLAVVVLGLAAFTDLIDGPIARRLHQTSELGAILDPIADKVLMLTALFLLASDKFASVVLIVPALLILWREIVVSGLREVLRHHGISSAVSALAKWKTAAQFISVLLLFMARVDFQGGVWCYTLGLGLLWLAALLTVYTGAQYLLRARRIEWK